MVGEDELGGAIPHHRGAAVLVHLQRGRLVHGDAPGGGRLAVVDLAGQAANITNARSVRRKMLPLPISYPLSKLNGVSETQGLLNFLEPDYAT
ncbi:MAG: hypothetical protein ACJ76N_18715, partial [Thermoanaerobaculia bacterium]